MMSRVNDASSRGGRDSAKGDEGGRKNGLSLLGEKRGRDYYYQESFSKFPNSGHGLRRARGPSGAKERSAKVAGATDS